MSAITLLDTLDYLGESTSGLPEGLTRDDAKSQGDVSCSSAAISPSASRIADALAQLASASSALEILLAIHRADPIGPDTSPLGTASGAIHEAPVALSDCIDTSLGPP
jgi:hypothetical protein